jgi:signal peptidase II
MSERIRSWPWLILAVLVALLDQASKWWVLQGFEPGEVRPVWPVFNLVLTFNEGAAFSFLSDAGGWQRWFFIGLTVIVSAGLLVWLLRLQRGEGWLALALSLVLGGALGNLVDRLRFGRVTDFLDFHWQGWHWPAFNLADSAITLGVVLLLFSSWRLDGPTRRQ